MLMRQIPSSLLFLGLLVLPLSAQDDALLGTWEGNFLDEEGNAVTMRLSFQEDGAFELNQTIELGEEFRSVVEAAEIVVEEITVQGTGTYEVAGDKLSVHIAELEMLAGGRPFLEVLTEVARLTALALPVTRGAKGIVSIPLPGEVAVFGVTIIPDFATIGNVKLAFYYVAAILMILCYAGLYRLVHSRLGHLCRSLQQNEELASSIGVNIAYLRILAYAISSFLGGIGGAVFVAISQSIYPSSFQVKDSIDFMLNCFLGGLGYVFGPMLGTLLLYFGWDLLFETGKFQLLIYSSVLIALILVLPNGLLSLRLPRRKKAVR